MANTKAPCPACGEVDRFRSAKDVCRNCRYVFDVELPALREVVAKLQQGRPTILYKHNSTSHWNPYIRGGTRELQDALYDMVQCVTDPVLPDEGPSKEYHPRIEDEAHATLIDFREHWREKTYQSYYGTGPDDVVRVTPEFRIAFTRLFFELEAALAKRYEEGRHAGANLLDKLVCGELSPQDVNKEATRLEQATT